MLPFRSLVLNGELADHRSTTGRQRNHYLFVSGVVCQHVVLIEREHSRASSRDVDVQEGRTSKHSGQTTTCWCRAVRIGDTPNHPHRLCAEQPYNSVEGLKKVMEVYDSHEMRKYKLEHFYDDSLVKELDDSGYIDSLYN